jgi:hypothetical protein
MKEAGVHFALIKTNIDVSTQYIWVLVHILSDLLCGSYNRIKIGSIYMDDQTFAACGH